MTFPNRLKQIQYRFQYFAAAYQQLKVLPIDSDEQLNTAEQLKKKIDGEYFEWRESTLSDEEQLTLESF